MSLNNCGFESELGEITLTVSEQGIARVYLPNQEVIAYHEQSLQEASEQIAIDFAAQLQSYLNGTQETFDLPLDWSAVNSDFQQQVLEALLRVSYGKTVSYGQLATRLGSPGASRAVGTALANNPLPLLIPCHRVILESGAIGNYAGGVELKKRLLALEQPDA